MAELLKGTLDDVGSSLGGLSKMVGGAGLVPMLAGAAAATASLTTSLTAAAGAGGIFGLSVFGVAKDMATQQKAITTTKKKLDTLDKGSAQYADTLKDLHNKQKAFNQDFGPAAKGYQQMTSAYGLFKDRTKGDTTTVLGKGMKLLADVLPRLVPVSNAAAGAVGGLLDDLSQWTKGPASQSLLDWFESSGPKAITHFGRSIGNTLSGLGGIFSNFVGPGDKAAASLERLTARFAKWSRSKGVSKSVDGFLKYVSNNSGKITSALSGLAKAAPKIASALGGLGSANLSGISMFLNLIAGLPQGAFDAVVTGMFGIVAASKAMAVVSGINALISGLSGAMALLEGACIGTRLGLVGLFIAQKAIAIWTGVVTAAQWAWNAALTANPIGIVVVAIAALVAAFIIAYKKSETFRKIVQAAWAGIKVGAKALWDSLKVIFKLWLFQFKLIGKFAAWLWNNAIQPAFKMIVKAGAAMMMMWAKMLKALSKVPWFGWAKKAASAMEGAANRAAGLADKIKKIPTSHSTKVYVDSDQAARNVAAIKKMIAGIHNKWVTITINYKTQGSKNQGQVPLPGRNAQGTNFWRGGPTWVNEGGPEIIDLPRGTAIHSAAKSNRMIQSASRDGGDLGTLTVVVKTETGEVIERKLARVKRSRRGQKLAFQ